MKNKFLTLLITLALCVQIFSLTFISFPADAASTSTSEVASASGGVSTYSDHIGWRTKVVNGKTYRRLYNYTKREWIGEWILIG